MMPENPEQVFSGLSPFTPALSIVSLTLSSMYPDWEMTHVKHTEYQGLRI